MRSEAYDRMKGFAIILMVMSHAMEPLFAPVSHWIYLFHMPVFFVLAGWFFSDANGQTFAAVCKFIAKKIKRLWWPYAFWTFAFVLLHNFLISINVYTDNPVLLEKVSGPWIGLTQRWGYSEFLQAFIRIPLMAVSTPLGGAMWFLKAMFFGGCLYCICSWIMQRIVRWNKTAYSCSMTALVVILVAAGRYGMPDLLLFVVLRVGGLEMFTAFFLIHLGVLFRRYNLSVERVAWQVQVSFAVAGLGGLVLLMPYGRISLGGNHFPSISFLTFATCLGWVGLVSLSCLVKSSVLAYVGRHTLPILILHFVAFKIVNYAGIVLHDVPVCLVAAAPTAYRGAFWACVYTLCGVMLPLVVDGGYRRVLRKMEELFNDR